MRTRLRRPGILAIGLLVTITSTATAKYSGGSGTAKDPYWIATAADLIALGETPADYNKHFILTADIDLDPNLPGRKVFDKAVIAPDTDANDPYLRFQGTAFTGVFHGNGYRISHLTIAGESYLGLFGQLDFRANVSNLGLEAVAVNGTGLYVGALVGYNGWGGIVSSCSSGSVSGDEYVGGLVGYTGGSITSSYSTGTVSGKRWFGGLVGCNYGRITTSYSSGSVRGTDRVGGLVGSGSPLGVDACVWDTETSTLYGSVGGVGLTTIEMMDPDMLGRNGFANDPNWVLDAGRDYPRLAWQGTRGSTVPQPHIDWLDGQGTVEAPHRIDTADQLILLGKASILWNRHFVLGADIDLDPALPGRSIFGQAVIPAFSGVLDGGGHVISHLMIDGGSYLGLFGYLTSTAEVRNIGVVDVTITETGSHVGGLVGWNNGSISMSYSTGAISGTGGLVGGLVGHNGGTTAASHSSGSVSGTASAVGGLVGKNESEITDCYSTSAVSGGRSVGGLVGWNGETRGGGHFGLVARCYSTGTVTGSYRVGGLVGWNVWGSIVSSVWDIETSGQIASEGGTGKTMAEMHDPNTFLAAGWDWVGEIGNGTHEIWLMPEGGGYPVLAILSGYIPPRLQGLGTAEDPYLISDALELGAMVHYSRRAHYRLAASIDLSGVRWNTAVIPQFGGMFDGNNLTISHLTTEGDANLGLFGRLVSGAEVRGLGLADVNISGSRDHVGSLVGQNGGRMIQCWSEGLVKGRHHIGGLAGQNLSGGEVIGCHSLGKVNGAGRRPEKDVESAGVAGLIGTNYGSVSECYSICTVSARYVVGGLVGLTGRDSILTHCYSSGSVSGDEYVGGLVGENYWGDVTASFWDKQTSGQTASAGGTGKTTAEMQTAKTFLDAGWDFAGETKNGTEDIWWILEGKDYPRLWWELSIEAETN